VLRVLSSAAILLAVLFGFSSVASGQGDEQVVIRANYIDAETGDRVPATGTVVSLLDENGEVVATGALGDDGSVALIAPGPGTYTAQLDDSTLPEGVRLRNEGEDSREIELRAGESRGAIFALEQGEGGGGGGSAFLTSLIRLSFDGLKFGLIIAMCAIGLSLIFGTTGLVNFAHGELVTFGALITLWFNGWMHVIPAAIIAVILTGVFGLMNERVVWRPLRNRSTGLIAMLVISIGLSILLRYVMLYFAGGNQFFYNNFTPQKAIEWGPLLFVPRDLFVMGIALLSLILVAFAVLKTRTGKAMRAVADNRDLAESSGIDVQKVIQTVWIGGGALAGLGGVLFGLDQGAVWDMGFELLLLMFAAVTLGGLGTAFGPLLGSIIVGLLVNVSTIQIGGTGLPTELKNIGALLVLVMILLVRPQGILGRRDRIG
jgi:branched-chain amino acid transport system permease protein